MKKEILVEPIEKRFKVSLQSANRKKRNRSFSSASDCCGEKLGMQKYCKECGEEHEWSSERKIVEIAGEQHLIDSDALDQVQEQLEQMEELRLHTFLDSEPEGAEDRYERLTYVYPEEKKEKDYKELREVLKGRVAVGTGVFRSNEYQVLVTVGDDGVIRIRRLVEESQRYDFNPEEIEERISDVEVSDEVINLEKEILDKNTEDSFDVRQFRDTRQEFEEKVIEDYVVNGKTPEVSKDIAEEQAQDELERLKKLAGE